MEEYKKKKSPLQKILPALDRLGFPLSFVPEFMLSYMQKNSIKFSSFKPKVLRESLRKQFYSDVRKKREELYSFEELFFQTKEEAVLVFQYCLSDSPGVQEINGLPFCFTCNNKVGIFHPHVLRYILNDNNRFFLDHISHHFITTQCKDMLSSNIKKNIEAIGVVEPSKKELYDHLSEIMPSAWLHLGVVKWDKNKISKGSYYYFYSS